MVDPLALIYMRKTPLLMHRLRKICSSRHGVGNFGPRQSYKGWRNGDGIQASRGLAWQGKRMADMIRINQGAGRRSLSLYGVQRGYIGWSTRGQGEWMIRYDEDGSEPKTIIILALDPRSTCSGPLGSPLRAGPSVPNTG